MNKTGDITLWRTHEAEGDGVFGRRHRPVRAPGAAPERTVQKSGSDNPKKLTLVSYRRVDIIPARPARRR